MIVVEGPDGSGKTTLAKLLCEKYDLEYRKPPKEVLSSATGPVGDRGLINWWLAEIARCRDDKAYRNGGVYDRTTFISDVVYRLACGHRPQGNELNMVEGTVYMANKLTALIFCLPAFEVTLANVHEEGRSKLDIPDEMLYNIWWAYYYFYFLWSEIDFAHVHRDDYTDTLYRNRTIRKVGESLGRS